MVDTATVSARPNQEIIDPADNKDSRSIALRLAGSIAFCQTYATTYALKQAMIFSHSPSASNLSAQATSRYHPNSVPVPFRYRSYISRSRAVAVLRSKMPFLSVLFHSPLLRPSSNNIPCRIRYHGEVIAANDTGGYGCELLAKWYIEINLIFFFTLWP
jgi:hypothetical protein